MLTTLATTGLLAQALPGGLIGIAIIFFIIAIVAYVLGARGVAGMSAGIGRTLLFVFLVLAIIFVISRIIYLLCYWGDLAWQRSLVWFVGFVCSLLLIISPTFRSILL